jgi:hypothetical protein
VVLGLVQMARPLSFLVDPAFYTHRNNESARRPFSAFDLVNLAFPWMFCEGGGERAEVTRRGMELLARHKQTDIDKLLTDTGPIRSLDMEGPTTNSGGSSALHRPTQARLDGGRRSRTAAGQAGPPAPDRPFRGFDGCCAAHDFPSVTRERQTCGFRISIAVAGLTATALAS